MGARPTLTAITVQAWQQLWRLRQQQRRHQQERLGQRQQLERQQRQRQELQRVLVQQQERLQQVRVQRQERVPQQVLLLFYRKRSEQQRRTG
jgi:hypothetical protein